MELSFEKPVPASPATVWRLVTEPDLMNKWSTASIRLLAGGDGGGPGSIGAYRSVTISSIGRTVRLKEVVEDVDPPHRYVYRAVDAPAIREHRGEISLRRIAGGTEVRWRVVFEMSAFPMELATKMILERQLRKSLDRLAEVAPTIPEAQPETAQPKAAFEDPADANLWGRAEEILETQRRMADRLDAAADPKRWFSRVYQYVTEQQLAWARGGRVRHVAWVLRLIPRFHHYYASNLRRRTKEESGVPEPQWRAAFDEMEGLGRKKEPRRMLFIGLLLGMRAHIEEDLPRALAEIWYDHYRGRCDYARFRADYLSMGGIFTRSSEQLLEHVPAGLLPWYFRGPGAWMPEDLKDSIRRKRYYDLPKARLVAFERGERLAAMLDGVGASARR